MEAKLFHKGWVGRRSVVGEPSGLAEGAQSWIPAAPPLDPVTVVGRGLCHSAPSTAEIAPTGKSVWEGQQRFSLQGQDLKPTGERPSMAWHRQPLQSGLLPLASPPGGPLPPPSMHLLTLGPPWGIHLCLIGLSATCMTSVLAGIKV